MIRHPHRRQRGFTLIEVLVTVVLISVGLLSIASLQLTTLRSNQEAYVRSQASVLAGDILDRIRANPQAFQLNQYNVAFNVIPTDITTRVGDDLDKWQKAIDAALPGADADKAGKIERLAGTNIVTITIQWSERPDSNIKATTGTDNGLRTFMTRSEI